MLRDYSTRCSEFADLLATVDPRWHDAVQAAIVGGGEMQIWPTEATLVRRVSLRVKKTKSGFSMDLSRRQPSGSVIATRARPTVPNAPMALDRMLHTMFEDREVTPTGAGSGTWDAIVGSFRGYAAEDAAKADLFESVDTALRERCEIYDNGQTFGITRAGDSEEDSAGIWISQTGDGWSFTHRVASPEGNSTRILGKATASAQNAAGTLNGLLEEMVRRMPAPELSAQDAYQRLLRDHVAPALRHHGYQGSGGIFDRTAGEYQVSIHFQKSRWSTRARVDYLLNILVHHPATAGLFTRANEEARALGLDYEMPSAGMYHAQFPGLTRSGRSWISLRPGEDLEAHAASLLADIYSAAFQAIEEQLHLPLPAPMPPAERGPRKGGAQEPGT